MLTDLVDRSGSEIVDPVSRRAQQTSKSLGDDDSGTVGDRAGMQWP